MNRLPIVMHALVLLLATAIGLQAANAGKGKAALPVIEFQKTDIPTAFKQLAKRAGIKLVIGENIHGTITTRLEDKTPMEVMEIIAMATNLSFKKHRDGIYYLTKPGPQTPKPDLTDSLYGVATGMENLQEKSIRYTSSPG